LTGVLGMQGDFHIGFTDVEPVVPSVTVANAQEVGGGDGGGDRVGKKTEP
jgi:hypothetical protein